MTARAEIRAELETGRCTEFDDAEHLMILRGYRDYYANEWYRKELGVGGRSPGPSSLDRQQALVLTWVIKQIAPETPLDYREPDTEQEEATP